MAPDGAGLDDGDDLEEFDDDDFEDEPEEPRDRRWPLGTLLGIAIGVWAGRAFYRLPDRLEDLAAIGLSVVTAMFAVGIYRRWVRRQLAEARARRLR